MAVSELKQKIELPEHMQKIPEHVQTALTEKLETAHAFLSNFRERLGSISTLDVAIMALRDIAESAQAKGLEGGLEGIWGRALILPRHVEGCSWMFVVTEEEVDLSMGRFCTRER